jgi:phosphoribosylanthranilate isomerase
VSPTPVAVKICGLTRPEDAAHAEACGAALLGVILAGGPRLLAPERARRVIGPRRRGLRRVAVFGAQTTAEIVRVANHLEVDVVQLHGVHDVDTVQQVQRETGRTVWPVVRVAGTQLPEEAVDLAGAAGALVLDALVAGQLGGTGVTLDWAGLADALSRFRAEVPGLQLVLAGGLRPSSVGEAIRLLSPSVVDVSSGVESAPGVKDPVLVQQFVQAAQSAMETQV